MRSSSVDGAEDHELLWYATQEIPQLVALGSPRSVLLRVAVLPTLTCWSLDCQWWRVRFRHGEVRRGAHRLGLERDPVHDNDAISGRRTRRSASWGSRRSRERSRWRYACRCRSSTSDCSAGLPSDAQWEVMDETFHRYYPLEHRVGCGLYRRGGGAARGMAIGRAQASRSSASLTGHDRAAAAGARCSGRVRTSCGWTGGTGPFRGKQGEALGAGISPHWGGGRGSARTVVIGDAADDAVAAVRVGARSFPRHTGGSA